jgi:hypothetical protein
MRHGATLLKGCDPARHKRTQQVSLQPAFTTNPPLLFSLLRQVELRHGRRWQATAAVDSGLGLVIK